MSDRSQYLLTLYIAEHRDDPPVSSGSVAERLGRSPATAAEMFHKLDDDGLVDYEPYAGATLTAAGRTEAAALHETYVLLSWFFRSVLDLEDHEQEAMEMAGVVGRDVADRLVATLPYDPPEEVSTGPGSDDAARQNGGE